MDVDDSKKFLKQLADNLKKHGVTNHAIRQAFKDTNIAFYEKYEGDRKASLVNLNSALAMLYYELE